ncbi:MAG: hypothetical protein O6923_05910, partial [Actinobacteria bacterium]|nr:hypothetical protein [Actinomycetota bacterium]
DIEETCDWVVMLDGGNLLRSGPLQGFEKLGTLLVEVLDDAEAVAARLRARGFGTTVEGHRFVVGPGDATLEQAIVEEAAALGSGLVRMVRGSASLEDLFLRQGEDA